MRVRFLSETRENGPDASLLGANDPPHPDRGCLEGRPWIVHDRDGASSVPDHLAMSALRRGAAFVSCPDFRPEVLKAAEESGRPLAEIIAKPLPGLLPPPPPVVVLPPIAEPSLVSDDTGSSTEPGLTLSVTTPPPSPAKRRRSGLALATALAIGAVAIGGATTRTTLLGAILHGDQAARPVQAASVVATPAAEGALAPPVVVDIDLDVPMKAASKADVAKSRFGRLTLRGDAKHKNVYFDGKRMLGAGHRSFLVVCGAHTIAVTDKADAKDVEVPCDGEYVVGR